MILGVRITDCIGDDCKKVIMLSTDRESLEIIAESLERRGARDVFVSKFLNTKLWVLEALVYPKKQKQATLDEFLDPSRSSRDRQHAPRSRRKSKKRRRGTP